MSAKSSAVPIHPAMVSGRVDGTQADYTTAEYASLMKAPMLPEFGKKAAQEKHPVEIYRGNPL